jgi:TIR domain
MLERYKYNIALSFAGEQRSYVHEVWQALSRANLKVFYDSDPRVQAAHLGERFSELAQRIYGTTSEFIVIFSSKEYVRKQWPFLESTYILDRMRELLFRENVIFIAKFDDAALPGFPKDILYTDLQKASPEQYADLLIKAIQIRKRIDQDGIITLFGKNDFQGIIDLLAGTLQQDLTYEDRVFVTYSLACAKARLSKRNVADSETLLSSGVEDLTECLALVEANRSEHLTEFAEIADQDDDLLPLRAGRPDRLKMILRRDKLNLSPTGISYARPKGCIDPASIIKTPTSEIPIKDLQVGDEVLCMSSEEPYDLKTTQVTHKRTFSDQERFLINGKLIASASQPLYSRGFGWLCPPQLGTSMELLMGGGQFEPVETIRKLDCGTVMIIGVADASHTFIADGFLCHNVTKCR